MFSFYGLTVRLHRPALMEEVQGQHAILRDCIEQLRALESSRKSLVSHLREALQEQVSWLDYFLVTSSLLIMFTRD